MFATEGVPFTTPNSNCIESWHNSGIKHLLQGRMKGATEYVLNKAIPDILEHYGKFHAPYIQDTLHELCSTCAQAASCQQN